MSVSEVTSGVVFIRRPRGDRGGFSNNKSTDRDNEYCQSSNTPQFSSNVLVDVVEQRYKEGAVASDHVNSAISFTPPFATRLCSRPEFLIFLDHTHRTSGD
jgi:hypothetical protein